ncbi:ribonuclease H-like domain-containing protein [Tanacetum coccineum]
MVRLWCFEHPISDTSSATSFLNTPDTSFSARHTLPTATVLSGHVAQPELETCHLAGIRYIHDSSRSAGTRSNSSQNNTRTNTSNMHTGIGFGNRGLDLAAQQQLLSLLQAQNTLLAQYGLSTISIPRTPIVSVFIPCQTFTQQQRYKNGANLHCLQIHMTLHIAAPMQTTYNTGTSSHLNSSAIFNSRMYPSVLVGDGKSIPVTNTGHSTLPTPYRPLHLNNVLVTPNISYYFSTLGRSPLDSETALFGDVSLYDTLSTASITPGIFAILRHPSMLPFTTITLCLIQAPPGPGFSDLQPICSRIIASLHAEFSMTDLGPLNYFLGVSVTRNTSGMFLSQQKYATRVLEPAGALQYLPLHALTSLNALQWFVSLCMIHESLISLGSQAILADMYVRGTLTSGLQLYSSTTSSLVAYSDADWAGCPTTRRSTSGYCVFLGNNLLSWSSKRQFTLSRSSAEAEYRGVANAVAETCWLRNLLRELHTPLSTATIVYCDNVSAVYLSSNPVQHQRTKHIEIDIHFVRDLVTTGHIRVLHVPSRYQYADIFTKGLPTALFDEFRDSLSVRSSPAQTAGGC